jgi:hypothetical protein
MRTLLTGDALRSRAESLGVSITVDESSESRASPSFRAVASEAELQRRVLAAESMLLQHRTWVLAAISAASSLLSALAACLAVYFSRSAGNT